MTGRWSMLALLFAIRASMAFQFQAVAALSPTLMTAYGVGLAEIGTLFALYLVPGIVIALPGGAIGGRFGDRRIVAYGLVLMLAGGLIVTFGTSWEAQVAGRLLAGIGGVAVNVLMSKMVTDLFADRGLATAMAVFVNSWPVGIAAALVALPPIAEAGGLAAALGAVAGFVFLGLLLLGLYRAPSSAAREAPAERPVKNGVLRRPASGAGMHPPRVSTGLVGTPLFAVVVAGALWGLYNAALGMVFGFGPAMLAERGLPVATASATTSVALWLVALSVPLGGLVADRSGRRDTVLLAGLVAFATALVHATEADAAPVAFAVLGLTAGIAAGPIMSLPSEVLQPANRARGMGVFFTLFYLAVVLAPVGAGHAADRAGSAAIPFLIGAAMLAACCPGLALFRVLARRAQPADRPVTAPAPTPRLAPDAEETSA